MRTLNSQSCRWLHLRYRGTLTVTTEILLSRKVQNAWLFLLQAEASTFQDLLTAASPTLTACGFSQESAALGPPGLDSDLQFHEALLSELGRHDWRSAACQSEAAEHLEVPGPAHPTSISPEAHPSLASSTSGRPAAVHQPSGAPSPRTMQNVQHSGSHGLPAARPQMGPSLDLPGSTQPVNGRVRHPAHQADLGLLPKHSIHASADAQPCDTFGPPELSLPRHSLDQPGGWRISAAHPSHQTPAAARSHPSNLAGSMPLPGMPIRAAQTVAQPPAISGG